MLDGLTTWLKTTIPGLIVLGTIGGILTTLVINILKRIGRASGSRAAKYLSG
jgi:hypothetical protein